MSKSRLGPIRSAIRRLANPAMVSWVSFGVTLTAWLLSMYPLVLRGEVQITPRTVGAWTVTVSAGQATIFAVLLIAKYLWLNRAWPRNHPSVAVWTIVVAAVMGLAVSRTVAGVFFGEPDWLLLGFEYLFCGVAVIVISGSASVVLSDYRASLTGLGATRASLEASIVEGRQQPNADRENVLEKAHGVIEEALGYRGHSPNQAATFLSEASDKVVRPLSHRLVQEPPAVAPVVKRTPAPRWSVVFSGLTQTSLLAPKTLALTVLALSWRLTITAHQPSGPGAPVLGERGVSVSVDWESFAHSLLQLMIVFIATFSIPTLVNLLVNRTLRRLRPSAKWWIHLARVVAVAVVSQAVIGVLFALAGFPASLVLTPPNVALIVVAVAGVTLLVGIIRAVGVAQGDIEAQLRDINDELEWSLFRLGQELWHQRREMGLTLHGTVRSALIASAMQLARGMDRASTQDIEQVRQRLLQVKNQLNIS